VQRRRLDPGPHAAEHGVVDERGRRGAAAEVDDPVPDRVRGDESLDALRLRPLPRERELQARRAGVYDEDVQVQSRISGSSSPCSRV
jgi:hypothetical protein